MSFLSQVVVNAIALFCLDALLDSVTVFGSVDAAGVVTGESGVVGRVLVYLVVGLLLALVNTVVRPFVKLLALPLYIVTLGAFGLVVNGLMLVLVSKFTPTLGFGLVVDGFGSAIGAGLVLSILTAIVSIPFRRQK
ncbi:MAG: phage holin family protein [Propionibacteriaceae bacterium]|nr:phage holin family protein [Propionibacteriaceae bacterium]